MTGIGVLLPLVSLLLRLIGSPVWSELAAAVDLNLHSTQSGQTLFAIACLSAIVNLPEFNFNFAAFVVIGSVNSYQPFARQTFVAV